MAVTYVSKVWRNNLPGGTPLGATGLNDLEARIEAAFAETVAESEPLARIRGDWDPSTNTPLLADGTGAVGDRYRVTTAATRDLGGGPIEFGVDDEVYYDGVVWHQAAAGRNYLTLTPGTSARNVAQATADAATPLTLKGYSATQSADLLQIQKSDASVQGGWSASGQLYKSAGVATANANVPGYVIPAGAKVFRVDPDGRVHMGENINVHNATGSTMHDSAPDWLYDPATMREYTRSTILGEIGDATEIQMRRWGPDNTYPGTRPAAQTLTGLTGAGEVIGQITAYPASTNPGGTPGVSAGTIQAPSAGIMFRTTEPPFTNAAGGQILFYTTPIGGTAFTNKLVIDSDGHIWTGNTTNNAHLSVRNSTAADFGVPVAKFQADAGQTAEVLSVTAPGINAFGVTAAGLVYTGQYTGGAAFGVRNSTTGGGMAFQVMDSGNTNLASLDDSGILTLAKDATIRMRGESSSSNVVFDSRLTGDTQSRFLRRVGGGQEWGPGNAAADVAIQRNNPSSLQIYNPAGGSANLTIGTGQLNIGNLKSTLDLSVRDSLASQVQIGNVGTGTGGISFGSAADTNIYRDAADTLKTSDSFHVALDLRHLGANLGFYNHATATQQTITGSRASGAALADLLTKLALTGLIVDGTSA